MPFSGKFLIGAAIGSGSMALAAERGGADFLLAINAGRLRNMGAPSIACMLPILEAGRLTERFAREELQAQCQIPVLLGVNVWESDFDPAATARRVKDAGFAGAVNFPSAMHFPRSMQQILARAGRGIEAEVAQLSAVREAGLTPMFYCATRTQARLAADAGIELICLNLGWNVGGALGHQRRASLEEVATMAREIGRLIKRINPRCRFFLEGGPVGTAEDLGRVLSLAPLDGYVGGSTFERLPLETSVADQIDRFRQAGRSQASLDKESARLVAWARPFGFVGRSDAQLAFLRRLKSLAGSSAPVLLLGEPGMLTEPALLALASPGGGAADRKQLTQGLIQVDVGGEDFPARARSVIFGHRDTIARQRPALADSGAAVLAIRAPERLPAATQRRLALALREGSFRAPGSRRALPVGPRVVLISEMPFGGGQLEDDLRSAGFEVELAAQFAGWTLRLPPLRERIDDLMALIESEAAASLAVALGRDGFTSAALQRLHAHPWPGNEAELHGLVGGLAGRAARGPIQLEELPQLLEPGSGPVPDRRSEKDRIVDALWRHGFNRTRAAEALGMSRKTLYNKIKRFGLEG